MQKRTAAGIPTWSPTVVLICRSTAYVWQSGRDAQFSADCGRTCFNCVWEAISKCWQSSCLDTSMAATGRCRSDLSYHDENAQANRDDPSYHPLGGKRSGGRYSEKFLLLVA